MFKQINKKASVLIYTIILTSISLILATVLLSTSSSLISIQKFYDINNQFYNQISSNNQISVDYLKKLNSDGGGFEDIYSGYWANISCRLQADGSYFVQWDSGSILWSDWFDDNCDNDNYRVSSSVNPEHIDNFEDNDTLARKQLRWIIIPKQQKNIFWNNNEINRIITMNQNNEQYINNVPLEHVTSWNLFLNVSTWALLTLIEYDRGRYYLFKEIRQINSFTWMVYWSWYIELNLNNLSLNPNIWTNTYNFDFTHKWYLLFLTNNDSDLIHYTLSWSENHSGSWLYLNPIIDDATNTGAIEVLWYDVIINEKWEIFWKMIKKIFLK